MKWWDYMGEKMHYHYIQVDINTRDKPPFFMGSMIRGAMGYALKKVTCIHPSYKCEGCFAQDSCLYFSFYEAQNNFHHYRFEIELNSPKFSFGLYLFAEASDNLAYVMSALHKTLTEAGLGKEYKTYNDFTIKLNGEEVYNGNEFKSLEIKKRKFELDSFCPNVKVKLQTPLRIKKNNIFLRENLELEDMLRSIYQREVELTYGEKVFKLAYEPSYTTSVKALNHQTLTRKSNRQKQTLHMDGMVGEIAVIGLDEESYRLLKLGEIVGVGKQTVLGLGRVEVEDF